MASDNENLDVVVVVVAPMVKNDGGKEEPLESELSKKLEIGEGSKAPMVENDSGKEEPLESEFSKKLVIEEEEGNGSFFKERTMSKKTVVLKSSDGERFEIDEAIAVQSQTIAHIVEDIATNEILLANVTGEILSKVIEYCKKHVGDDDSEFASVEVKEDLKKWDAEFMEMDQSTMYELILAANYLNVKGLLALACQTVADMISACKTAEKIREKFGIENDFTPEEEEQVRQENQWAFE